MPIVIKRLDKGDFLNTNAKLKQSAQRTIDALKYADLRVPGSSHQTEDMHIEVAFGAAKRIHVIRLKPNRPGKDAYAEFDLPEEPDPKDGPAQQEVLNAVKTGLEQSVEDGYIYTLTS